MGSAFALAMSAEGTVPDVSDAKLLTGQITVPEFMDNCVLGGRNCSDEGQGFLDMRANLKSTCVGLEKNSELVCWPGGKQVVNAGDTVLLPLAIRDSHGVIQTEFNVIDKGEHENFFGVGFAEKQRVEACKCAPGLEPPM